MIKTQFSPNPLDFFINQQCMQLVDHNLLSDNRIKRAFLTSTYNKKNYIRLHLSIN